MKKLKKYLPVLLSPKFHGLVLYLLLGYLQAKGYVAALEFEYLQQLVGLATGIGALDSAARKIGGKKK